MPYPQFVRSFVPALSPAPSVPDFYPEAPAAGPRPVWDIFCAVVDNYGDVAVCWRLARQLAAEYPIAPRLWVDEPAAARRLIPALDPKLPRQTIDGVEIRRWEADFPAVEPGEMVIAAFACSVPDSFLQAMARQSPPPLWINLEYLSAEEWVADCHRLPSPHPRLPLTQYFYFPGIDARTGGLLRERDYDARRAEFSVEAFRAGLGLPEREDGELLVSLFAYENPGVADLLSAWEKGDTPVICLVPEGRVMPQVAATFGVSDLRVGDRMSRGALAVQVLPFVEQSRYDELLWASDLNFVRGEDSFVRAQWAERPFVWQIYPQQEQAHMAKLEAFMTHYREGLPLQTAEALAGLWRAWNSAGEVAAAWPAFRAALPALAAHGQLWSDHLQAAGGLAAGLVQFRKDALK